MVVQQITELISRNPEQTVFYLIVGKIVAAVVMFPGTPLTILAGATLGVVKGSIVSVVGNFFGATSAFFISRYLFKDWVQRNLVSKYPQIKDFEQRFVDNGFATTVLLRLIPLFPFNILNYALGVTHIKTRDYMLGTFIGIIPGTIVFVYFGEAVMMLSIFHIALSFLAILGLTYIGKHYEKKYKNKF